MKERREGGPADMEAELRRDAATSQGTCGTPRSCGSMRASFPGPSKGAWLWGRLGSGLLAPRAVRGYVSGVLSHPGYAALGSICHGVPSAHGCVPHGCCSPSSEEASPANNSPPLFSSSPAREAGESAFHKCTSYQMEPVLS